MRRLAAMLMLLALAATGQVQAQSKSVEEIASETGLPVLARPADGDTVRSMWVRVEGAIPINLMGKLSRVEIYVNEAKRGVGRIRGVRFAADGIRLDCSSEVTVNTLKAVGVGPSLRVHSDPIRVKLVPDRLRIEPELSTDSICPGEEARGRGVRAKVSFRFRFSTPADWTFRINGGGKGHSVRVFSGQSVPECELEWDGTDESGEVVGDGEYLYEITAVSTCGDAGSASYAGVVTVDTSVPGRPKLIEPEDAEVLSPDLYLKWSGVEGAWFYEVQVAESDSFLPHDLYTTGATELHLAKRPDGLYYWRVRGVSRAGMPGPYSPVGSFEVRKVVKPAISMLGVTTRADGVTLDRGEAMRITYMANDDVVVTIRIVTADGRVVKTLVDGVLRKKGPHVELWDARDEEYELVPAGAYIAVVEAEGTDNVTPFKEKRLITIVY